MRNKFPIEAIYPGLLATLLAAGLGIFVSGYYPQPGAVCLAILLGLILGNFLPAESRFHEGFDFVEQAVLPLAIAMMGSELDLRALGATGLGAVFSVLPPMVLSILLAVPLGGLFGLGLHGALMLGIGNSVCGSSAVLAASPALKVEKQEVAVAIAAVNLMGTIGMFVLPGVAEVFDLSDEQTANLIGGSLQAVGQVAASGFSISEIVGDHALVVKMLRVMMIGPLVMFLHQVFQPTGEKGKRTLPHFPGYILGFMLFAVFGSLLPSGHIVLEGMREWAKFLLVIAMVAVGSRIHFSSLLRHGSKALALVTCLSLIQAGIVLFLVLWRM